MTGVEEVFVVFGFEEIQFECINFGALCLANRWSCGVKPMVIKKAPHGDKESSRSPLSESPWVHSCSSNRRGDTSDGVEEVLAVTGLLLWRKFFVVVVVVVVLKVGSLLLVVVVVLLCFLIVVK